MKQYDFTLVLAPGTELTDGLVEALYESECDDGSPGCRGGVVWVTLHREEVCQELDCRPSGGTCNFVALLRRLSARPSARDGTRGGASWRLADRL